MVIQLVIQLAGFPVGYRIGPESHWFIILYWIHGRVIGLGGWVFNSTLIWLFSSFDFTKLGLVYWGYFKLFGCGGLKVMIL